MPFQSIGGEMRRFKAGKLHSGSGGPVVKKRKQAVAIALSEARRAGQHIPVSRKKMPHGGA